MTTKSKFSAAGKSQSALASAGSVLRSTAYDRDPAYEANPYDPFEDITTPRRRRRRRTSLKRVIAQAKKAGVDAIVSRDGSVTLRFGERGSLMDPLSPIDSSEWN